MKIKKAIVVVGPGRSGTSVITRALTVLGVSLGDNLMPPKAGVNDKGFWEDQDIYELNIEIFQKLNQGWQQLSPPSLEKLNQVESSALMLKAGEVMERKFRQANTFGMKDPQMTRLLPFWRDVFWHEGIEQGYVLATRNPMSVARSLSKYTGIDLTWGYLLWFVYTVASLRDTAESKRVVVDYDLIMSNPEHELVRISEVMDFKFDRNSKEYIEYQSQFLEGGLRHLDFQLSDLSADGLVPAEVRNLYEFMLDLSNDVLPINGEEARARIGEFQQQLESPEFFTKCLREYEGALATKRQELAARDLLIDDLGKTVTSIIADRDSQKEGVLLLKEEVKRQEGLVKDLGMAIESLIIDRDSQAAAVQQLKVAYENKAHEHNSQVAELNRVVAERDEQVAQLYRAIADREALVSNFSQKVESLVIDRDSRVAALQQLQASYENMAHEHNSRVAELNRVVAEHVIQLEKSKMELSSVYKSKSWRLTSPLRWVVRQLSSASKNVANDGHVHEQAEIRQVQQVNTNVEVAVNATEERSKSKFRILLVSHYCPTRAHAGGLRILDIYALIRSQCPNVQLDLLTFHRPSIDWSLDDVNHVFHNVYLSPTEELTPEVLLGLRGSPLHYEVIDLQFHQSGYQIDAFKRIGSKIIFTPMESLAKVAFINLRTNLLTTNSSQLLKVAASLRSAAEEVVFALKANEVVCVSRADAAFLRTVTSSRRVLGLDTGVSQFEFAEALSSNFAFTDAAKRRCNVLYVAYFGSETNVLALRWYLDNIHQLIKNKVPNYVLTIVGRGDLSFFAKYKDDSLELVGEVAAIAPYIQEARVCIAPALGGSGFRGKVNQYAVLGVPSVVSPIAHKGLVYQDGVNIFVAELPEIFADRCISLLTDFELNDRMGKAARETCLANYSWQSKWPAIRKIYNLDGEEARA